MMARLSTVRVATLGSFLICLTLSGCLLKSKVIVVTITNHSQKDIRNIEVTYPGGSFGVSRLNPEKSFRYVVKPFFTGTMEIQYIDAAGNHHKKSGPRVNKDDSGNLEFAIDDSDLKWDGKVTGS